MTFANQTIDEFLKSVASDSVTPSGGAVAAIGGATGAALCEMVCIHTLGRNIDPDVEQEVTRIHNESNGYREQLIELADEDSVAVNELQRAFNSPNIEDCSEKTQKASKRATNAPLKTAGKCLEVLENAIIATEICNQNAITDAGTGAFLAYGALRASISTVHFNLELIDDAEYVDDVSTRAEKIDNSSKKVIEPMVQNASGWFE